MTQSSKWETRRLFPVSAPHSPQLPRQGSEQLTLAQRRMITHMGHKTSSGAASLPSSGAVWSPETQAENTTGHRQHSNEVPSPQGGAEQALWNSTVWLGAWGMHYRLVAYQELKAAHGSVLDHPRVLRMGKLRPCGDRWLSQDHTVGWRNQEQATSFTFSSTWTIKSPQGDVCVPWGCRPGYPSLHVVCGAAVLRWVVVFT